MTDAQPQPDAPARNVIEALARVSRDLPSIGKDMQFGGNQGYKYRGIEAITAHASPLLARECVVFVPRVLSAEPHDFIQNNNPWIEWRMLIEYTVYGPGGVGDQITVGPFFALGRDNSDKGGNKCQPPGTMVRVPTGAKRGGHAESHADWAEVPIESLRAGDRVVTWQRRRSALRSTGRTVTGVAVRPYEGPLIVIESGGMTSRYTPDHHCLVRLPDQLAAGNEIVYLMRRGEQYRIGRCRWHRETVPGERRSRIGLANRCAQEDADAAWVLSVHETVAEAAMNEVLASVRFGIPQTSFTGATDAQRGERRTAFDLPSFWSKVGNNGPQAASCLAHFGRLVDRPLFERRADRSQLGMLPTIETAAANLLGGMIVGLADAPVASDQGWRSWPVRWEASIVRREFYSGLVHSLDVDEDHNYIADGVLTGNCLTQAYKYALLQVLCIADAKDDGDSERVETGTWASPEPTADEVARSQGWESAAERQPFYDRMKDARAAFGDAENEAMREWMAAEGLSLPCAKDDYLLILARAEALVPTAPPSEPSPADPEATEAAMRALARGQLVAAGVTADVLLRSATGDVTDEELALIDKAIAGGVDEARVKEWLAELVESPPEAERSQGHVLTDAEVVDEVARSVASMSTAAIDRMLVEREITVPARSSVDAKRRALTQALLRDRLAARAADASTS